MYEKHFGLSKNPFQSIAEGQAVFEGAAQTKVIADLKMALTGKDSIAVITGPVGVGKTTIVQRAMEQMGSERLVAILGRTQVVSDELVDLLLAQFGVVRAAERRFECLKAFNRILRERADAGDPVFIVIEDAERLGEELLEELEALTAADGGDCVGANIILMGRQKLDKLIAKPALERVRQRIHLQQTLDRFTADEVESYLHHRIKAVGGDYDTMFEPGTALMVRRCSGGIPRVINSLCETALKMAAEGNSSQVSGKIVFKVAVEIFGMSPGDTPTEQESKVKPPPKPMAPAAPQKAPTAKAAEPAPSQAAAPTAPAAKKSEPVAKKPSSVAAKPTAAADKNFDPTATVPKIPVAPEFAKKPQHATTPRSPKPPSNTAPPASKPAAPAAAGATIPAAEAKPSAGKPLPELPPKFKFAEEIIVDRDTKPAVSAQPRKQVEPPELHTLELDDGAEKINVKKTEVAKAPVPPSAPATNIPTLAESSRVDKVVPEVKKEKAKPAANRSEPKVDEQTASFAKVDHDMLDAALASLAVHDDEDESMSESNAPPGDGEAPASIPEVTLDKSIEAKRAEAKATTDPALLQEMAQELEKTKSLEEMSDQLAETLFGNEELEAISLQIRDEATLAEEDPIALEPEPAGVAAPANAPRMPTPEVAKTSAKPAPAPQPPAALKPPTPPKTPANVAVDGKSAAAAAPPPARKGAQPEPIENQFNSSMTGTLETLNSRNKPPDDDDDSEKSSGGLLGRLKNTFKS